MINSRKLEDLDPVARAICEKQMVLCKAEGIDMLVVSTYRDFTEQDRLYAVGRTTFPDGPNTKKVTDAKAGSSFHNFKCAWDACPVINKACVWDVKHAQFKRMVELGIQAGAESGMYFPLVDSDHFQVRPIVNGAPITTAEAFKRFVAKGTIF